MNAQQLAILAFCYGYQRRHGYAPTQAEIAAALCKRQASIARSLRRMERLGYVQRSRCWRGLRVVRLPAG